MAQRVPLHRLQHGIPTSIAVYFGLVLVAMAPTLLLPLSSLGRTSGSAKRGRKVKLARESAIPLLIEEGGFVGGRSGSISGSASLEHQQEGRQHGCTAAELAIELAGPDMPGPDVEDGQDGSPKMLSSIHTRVCSDEMQVCEMGWGTQGWTDCGAPLSFSSRLSLFCCALQVGFEKLSHQRHM